MLIVWDKAFGTFLDEQGLLADGTEREAYGVVHAARTWDPLVAQFEAFASLLQRAALHASPSLWWRVLMVGPGYRPNMKTAVLPPIGPTVARIRRATQLQPATQAYVLAHFALAIAGVRVRARSSGAGGQGRGTAGSQRASRRGRGLRRRRACWPPRCSRALIPARAAPARADAGVRGACAAARHALSRAARRRRGLHRQPRVHRQGAGQPAA